MDQFVDGVSRRVLLSRLVMAAEGVGNGVGACFTVVEPDGGRVVATSGSCEWMLGRHIPWKGSASAALTASGRRWGVFDVEHASPTARSDLRSHGVLSGLLLRATTAGRTVGVLHVFYEGPPAVDGARHTALELVTSACGLLVDGLEVTATTVAASIADGLAVLGGDGTVRSWNRAAQQLTGLSREAVLYGPMPFPVPEPGQVLDHCLASGRWIQMVCSALGSTGERVVTFRDITRPKVEDEAKDLFLATTSHELRTPVTVVKGYADTLVDRWGDLDADQRLEGVQVIQQRSAELAELVDRLLLGAKPSDGAVRLPSEPFDLGQVVVDATRGLLDASSRHRLVLDLPPDLPPARGDRVSMGTVLAELVSNAAKYSPDGGEIALSASHDASTVVVRVADRGVGVPADDVERVFDRFWQAENGDQRRFGGVGLGLYIARHLMDRQSGWISLRSREGGGTVVEVRLPRADIV
jgi:signal transduction histidine kinase